MKHMGWLSFQQSEKKQQHMYIVCSSYKTIYDSCRNLDSQNLLICLFWSFQPYRTVLISNTSLLSCHGNVDVQTFSDSWYLEDVFYVLIFDFGNSSWQNTVTWTQGPLTALLVFELSTVSHSPKQLSQNNAATEKHFVSSW